MIQLRRADERRFFRRGGARLWKTFYGDGGGTPLSKGFGALEMLNEYQVPPGGRVASHGHNHGEIITYVRTGALTYEDFLGRSGVVLAGELRCVRGSVDLPNSARNASQRSPLHVFQIRLQPAASTDQASSTQRRFSAAERRGMFCIIASPDARARSLRIDRDVVISSVILEVGQHVIYELADARCAWVQVATGQVAIAGQVVGAGDGAGITGEATASMTAQEPSELLLFELAEDFC